jgi:hypothetical protein
VNDRNSIERLEAHSPVLPFHIINLVLSSDISKVYPRISATHDAELVSNICYLLAIGDFALILGQPKLLPSCSL